jgi:hypothetical protein
MENIKKERNPKDMTVEYEKGPPRLGNRAWKLLLPFTARQQGIIVGNFSISQLISWTVIFSHSSHTTTFISAMVVIFTNARCRCILRFIRVQILSIALKSGELETQASLGMPSFTFLGLCNLQCVVMLDLPCEQSLDFAPIDGDTQATLMALLHGWHTTMHQYL